MGIERPDVTDLREWCVTAQNLPEHARNPIHTDAGARAAGFPRALVAGVTTYAYLTHPVVVGWGLDWLDHGGGEVRFRRPVFDGDQVCCVPMAAAPTAGTAVGDGAGAVSVDARTGEPEQPRAVFRAVRRALPPTPLRPGEALPDHEILLDGEFGSDYGIRAGDDLAVFGDLGLVHPAVWPALANHVVHRHVARGSWVHVRSIVRHHGRVASGSTATVRSTVVRRFEAHGERAVLDVHVVVGGAVVASLEHEAIVALP